MEAYDAIPFNAAVMTRRGVVVSIHSDSNEHARRFYQEAAKMLKYGDLTEEEALRLRHPQSGDPAAT
jgi:imidazolonepropionase-like amidohydrolase